MNPRIPHSFLAPAPFRSVCQLVLLFLALALGGAKAVTLQINKQGNSVRLSWAAQQATSYTLEYTDTFPGSWRTATTLLAETNTASWIDTNTPSADRRFYRLIEHGSVTNALLAADALPQQVLAAQLDSANFAASAVYLASQLQGGLRLITNGTLTQTAVSWTYSPAPADRLVAQFLSGTNVTAYIRVMLGNFSGDAANFLSSSHDFRYRVVIPGGLDMVYTSLRNGCDITATAQGSFVSGGISYDTNLRAAGQYCSETGGGYTSLLDDHTVTGSISRDRFNLAVDQRRRFELISDSSRDATSAQDWINSRLTIGTDVFQWSNVYKRKSFTNGHPSHIDPSASDLEWQATGAVLKNGAAFGNYRYSFSPLDLYVRFLLQWPGTTIELEHYSR